MFMSGLSESKQTHVHMRNMDPATLQIIITYAYTGNLAISDSTVEPLYETACFLQVARAHTHILYPSSLLPVFPYPLKDPLYSFGSLTVIPSTFRVKSRRHYD